MLLNNQRVTTDIKEEITESVETSGNTTLNPTGRSQSGAEPKHRAINASRQQQAKPQSNLTPRGLSKQKNKQNPNK